VSEIDLFVNEGFGWECKGCRATGSDADAGNMGAADALSTTSGADTSRPRGGDALPRFFREGEAEERDVRLSTRALARWQETPEGRALRCPRCGAEEVPPADG
jgi:hypothetical protein